MKAILHTLGFWAVALIALVLVSIQDAGSAFDYGDRKLALAVKGFDEPCEAEIDVGLLLTAAMQGVDVQGLKRAVVMKDGEVFKGCWVGLTATRMFIVDERGGFGFIDIGTEV